MTLQLEYKGNAEVPLEVEGILPETLRDQTVAEIERAAVFHGNESGALADFFRVSGDSSDDCLEWTGDLSGVHWIGTKMSRGTIRVDGPAGRHVGSEMRGGRIEVSGDVSDWLGGEMQGGLIRVRGRAGHLVAAAYRGSPRGMTGGTILVDGNAGNEIGHSMRRGMLAVGGDVGDLVGFNMLAGSIFVGGRSGIRHGAANAARNNRIPGTGTTGTAAFLPSSLSISARHSATGIRHPQTPRDGDSRSIGRHIRPVQR